MSKEDRAVALGVLFSLLGAAAIGAAIVVFFVKPAAQVGMNAQREAMRTTEQLILLQGQVDRVAKGAGAAAKPGAQKLCVVVGDGWRDAIAVSAGANATGCGALASALEGTAHRLGCAFEDGASLGGDDGAVPERNCGW